MGRGRPYRGVTGVSRRLLESRGLPRCSLRLRPFQRLCVQPQRPGGCLVSLTNPALLPDPSIPGRQADRALKVVRAKALTTYFLPVVGVAGGAVGFSGRSSPLLLLFTSVFAAVLAFALSTLSYRANCTSEIQVGPRS